MKLPIRPAALIAAGVALVLVAATWIIAMASSPDDASRSSDAKTLTSMLTVNSVAARIEEWPATIEAFGSIAPWEEMIVSAQVEGQALVEVRVNVGERVRRGQLLAQFDTDMLRAEVNRLYAEVDQARAEVGQADAERDRTLQLADSGGVSKQDVTQRVTAAQVAAARLNAARAQLAARELEIKRASVVAPDDGTLSARHAMVGMVGTSGLELFRLIRQDRLEWRGELTAAQLSRAAPGQQVLLTLPGGGTARARIRHLAPAMNAQTRLATIYADIEPTEAARAGTYVSGRIVLAQSSALIVPASSIVIRDGYSFVFKLASEEGEQRAKQQLVEVGRRRGTDVEILTGLSRGEYVVARGAGFLNDRDSVRAAGGATP